MGTVRKRSASVTVNAGGNGWDDLLLSTFPADGPTRFAGLFGVEVLSEDNTNTKACHVEVWELVPDEDNEGEYEYGDLLFHVGSPRYDVLYQPRVESNTQSVDHDASYPASADTTGEENVLPRVRTARVRVEVTGATASSVVPVDVFIQSAGDQRF